MSRYHFLSQTANSMILKHHAHRRNDCSKKRAISPLTVITDWCCNIASNSKAEAGVRRRQKHGIVVEVESH